MQIKISKSQWLEMGKKAGWMGPSDGFMQEHGICVYDYDSKSDKYATDCNTMVSAKFVDDLRTDDNMRCPKCKKKIVTKGRTDDEEREMEERAMEGEPPERDKPHTMWDSTTQMWR